MKILIIDDLYENRKILLDMLVEYGECDIVSNGPDALTLFDEAHLDQTPYDLILLDIMMPSMDGQEVLRTIRGREKETGVAEEDEAAIIIVTALHSPMHMLEAFFEGGCTSYIEKPFTKKNLFKKIREYQLRVQNWKG
jgi:two-component system, chemotaxis family, chemotaxis protein CheY